MDKNLKISVCIPTWEQYGDGTVFLHELFFSLKKQTYKNFNVIISDHSLDEEIKKIVDYYKDFFEIIYVKNTEKRGNGPANTNNCIKHANGDIIKIMFQDDLFFDKESLKKINETFYDNSRMWVVNGCNHTNDGINFNNEMVPQWNDQILFGINTISSPSVLSFRNYKENNLLFDINLTMLMDCEYYFQLYNKFGLPTIMDEILTTNRIHNKQISSMYNKSNLSDEINYVKNKYKL